MESWKKINDFENYSVSTDGEIRNDTTGRILKKHHDKHGYELVRLSKNGRLKTFRVHRLVAVAFLPNTYNLPCVDHINTVRDDNRVENLRWCTQKENCNNKLSKEKYSNSMKGENNHNYGRTGKNNAKSKKVICITTGEIYESTLEAERKTGVNHSSISSCCREERKSAGKDELGNKLFWRYLEK